MKECMNCKAQVEDSVKVCPECGGEQFAEASGITQSSDNNVAGSVQTPASKPANSGKPKIKAAFIISIIAIALCWLPFVNIALSVTAAILVILSKVKKDEFSKTVKSTVALILTIVALVVSVAVVVLFISVDVDDTIEAELETEVLSKDEFVARCTALDYKAVAGNPDSYKGKYAVLQGEVIQAFDMKFLGKKYVTLLVDENSDNKQVWYVTFEKKDGDSTIAEGDIVKLYGICQGVYTYEANSGDSITVPYIEAEYEEIVR